MKVVFEGNETADVSEIQSVEVVHASRIKVRVKYQTKKTGKDFYLAYPHPSRGWARRHLPQFAKTIAKELESLSKVPDMPIEQVVELIAWRNAHLQVKMDTNSHAAACGLASLCWYYPLDRTPKDEQLEFRTGLSTDEIEKIASADIYKQSIETLMFETYSTPDKFKWWLRDYGRNMPKRLGKRMRLCEDTATELINSAADQYGIGLGNLKASSTFFEYERTIGSGRQSVYCYYYQWDRDSAESKGQNVWECKIGLAKGSLQKRLRDQATDPENFNLGLHIQTDNPVEIEDVIHDELKERGQHLDESLRTEWFLTNPNEVKRIYKRI